MCQDGAPEKLLALVLGQEIFRHAWVLDGTCGTGVGMCQDDAPEKLLALVLGQEIFRHAWVLDGTCGTGVSMCQTVPRKNYWPWSWDRKFSAMPGYRTAHAELE